MLAVFGPPAFAGAAEGGEAASTAVWLDPDPSWQVNTSLSGRRYSVQNVAPDFSTDGTSEGVNFALTSYFAPLRDDGAPYSLQPFLQRSSDWSLTLDGGHFSTRNPFGGADRTDWSGGVGGAVDAYLKRWLAVTGGFGYGYSVLHDGGLSQPTRSLDGAVGLGLRAANTRFDVSYTLEALDASGTFAPLRQRVRLSAFMAVARRFTVNLSGALIPHGAEGNLSLEYFPTREVGIFGGAFVGRGELYSDSSVPTRGAGWIGLAGWFDPTFGILGQYELTIEDLSTGVGPTAFGYHEVMHTVTFELFARFSGP